MVNPESKVHSIHIRVGCIIDEHDFFNEFIQAFVLGTILRANTDVWEKGLTRIHQSQVRGFGVIEEFVETFPCLVQNKRETESQKDEV